jgi:hypothetical protein
LPDDAEERFARSAVAGAADQCFIRFGNLAIGAAMSAVVRNAPAPEPIASLAGAGDLAPAGCRRRQSAILGKNDRSGVGDKGPASHEAIMICLCRQPLEFGPTAAWRKPERRLPPTRRALRGRLK